MDDDQEAPPPLSDKETKDLVGKIQSVLTPDLLKPKYRKMSEGEHPTFGHCGSATQAAYYMLGGEESGYVPQVANLGDGTTHWWLRHRDTGHVIDPTKEQFTSKGKKPPYDLGRGCGFSNPNPDVPSKRGQEIINRIRGRAARASGGPVDESDIASPPPAEETGIDAYHGSPHEFEQFDSSKIGTGEGAQAYGHGLYFAEHEPIAKGYRDNLSSNGHMYEVRINAHPDHLLDWDKPLSKQSDYVRKALEGFGIKISDEDWKNYDDALLNALNHGLPPDFELNEPHDPSGQNIYKSRKIVGGTHRDNAAVSKALLDAGIKGIKYLDANSRGAKGDTHNYVVFDDKLINIKRR